MDKLHLFREKLRELDLDGALIFDELNQRYLCDYAFTDGFLAISQDEALLVTDFRYYESALEKADKSFRVINSDVPRSEVLKRFISENSVKRIGFEGGSVTYALYKAYSEKYSELEFVDLGDIIEKIRG